MTSLLALLHPRLPALARHERLALLRAAAAEPFDAFELVALAATVILAAWHGPGTATVATVASAGACVLLRRMRRGVERRIPK